MPPRRSTRAARAADDDAAAQHDEAPSDPPPPQAAAPLPGPDGAGGADTARDDAVGLLNDAKLATSGEAKVGGRERAKGGGQSPRF